MNEPHKQEIDVKALLDEIEDYGKYGKLSKVVIDDDNYISVRMIKRIILNAANGGKPYNWED